MNTTTNSPHNTTPSPTVRHPEGATNKTRVVLFLGNAPDRRIIEDHFQKRGWEVCATTSAEEMRKQARKSGTVAVVMVDEFSRFESGWLLCQKLRIEKSKRRVVILGTKPYARAEGLSEFVGASAYVPPGASPSAVETAVTGMKLPSKN